MQEQRTTQRYALAIIVAGAAVALVAAGVVLATFAPGPATATSQFARQTGKPCLFCHESPNSRKLNREGEQFKANGNRL